MGGGTSILVQLWASSNKNVCQALTVKSSVKIRTDKKWNKYIYVYYVFKFQLKDIHAYKNKNERKTLYKRNE